MARILIGWELGSNRGHAEAIRLMAARLLDAGHDVTVALQQIDALGLDCDPRLTLYQAPLWPRLLASQAQSHQRAAATMGDILARLGLDKPGCLAALIAGWDTLFAQIRPDVVIADFAPALLTAARGRIATINTGSTFTCPPDDAAAFPRLIDHLNAVDESLLLDTVDADLRSVARQPLPALPALFSADRTLIASFAELDPYAAHGRTYCAPPIVPPIAEAKGGQGDELFVYSLNRFGPDHPLWAALTLVKRPIRLFMPDPSAAHLSLFGRMKIIVEAHPVPFPKIANRSAATLSYGGHGFLCANLLAALPQMVTSFDLEKRLNGTRLEALGWGRHMDHAQIDPEHFAAQLEEMIGDQTLADRLRSSAPILHARMTVTLEDEVARTVVELAGEA